MIALYIGRFQPFHNGHLDAIKQILKKNNSVYLVISSAQYSRTKENPFSFTERKEMIEKILNKEKINFKLFFLEDIHNNEKWIDYVKKNISHFDIVYSNNPLVKKLFEEKNVKVESLNFNIKISAEKIRNMIIENNIEWKNFIHKDLIEFIEKEGKEIIIKSNL